MLVSPKRYHSHFLSFYTYHWIIWQNFSIMSFFRGILQNDLAITNPHANSWRSSSKLSVLIEKKVTASNFVHLKHVSLSLSNGGVHHYQMYDIFQLSNLSVTYKDRVCISKIKYTTTIEGIWKECTLEGFIVLIQLFVAKICEVWAFNESHLSKNAYISKDFCKIQTRRFW